MSYTIQRDPSKVLVVEHPELGELGSVPLASSLPVPWMLRHRELAKLPEDERGDAVVAYFYDLFKHYLGDAVDELTLDGLGALIDAWSDATREEEGIEAGE